MARSFNGTSDVITIGDVIDLAGLSTFTLFAWIFPTSITLQRIISKWGGVSDFQYLCVMDGAGRILVVAHDASGHQPQRQSTSTLSANQWYAVAVRMNGPNANDMSIFINGVGAAGFASGSALNGGIQNTTQPLAIGDDAGASRTAPFHGRIEHAAIWDVALHDQSFVLLGAGLLPTHVQPESLQAYWPLWGVDSPEVAVCGTARTAGTLTGTSFGAGAPVTSGLVDLW